MVRPSFFLEYSLELLLREECSLCILWILSFITHSYEKPFSGPFFRSIFSWSGTHDQSDSFDVKITQLFLPPLPPAPILILNRLSVILSEQWLYFVCQSLFREFKDWNKASPNACCKRLCIVYFSSCSCSKIDCLNSKIRDLFLSASLKSLASSVTAQ